MNKQLMFLDDDEAFLMIVGHVCRRIPGLVPPLRALDGVEGLETLQRLLHTQQRLPNMVFVDINMPRMDGFQFLAELKQLREQYPELRDVRPVAMLTSSDQERDREKARSLGADAYFVKPSGLEEIKSIVLQFVA